MPPRIFDPWHMPAYSLNFTAYIGIVITCLSLTQLKGGFFSESSIFTEKKPPLGLTIYVKLVSQSNFIDKTNLRFSFFLTRIEPIRISIGEGTALITMITGISNASS